MAENYHRGGTRPGDPQSPLRQPEAASDHQPETASAGFRVIPPNEARRQKLLDQARAEAEAYERFRESRLQRSSRMQMISEAPRRLRDVVDFDHEVPSIDEARARQQQLQSTAKARKFDRIRQVRLGHVLSRLVILARNRSCLVMLTHDWSCLLIIVHDCSYLLIIGHAWSCPLMIGHACSYMVTIGHA